MPINGGDSTTHPYMHPSPITQSQQTVLLEHLCHIPHPEHPTSSIQTPTPVIRAITHGFSSWLQARSSHVHAHTAASQLWLQAHSPHIHAHTAASQKAPDILLTAAFHEQYHDLEWFQFCLGWVSLKWASAE
jgi:hypothetical protein